jgi:hypothetical protein
LVIDPTNFEKIDGLRKQLEKVKQGEGHFKKSLGRILRIKQLKYGFMGEHQTPPCSFNVAPTYVRCKLTFNLHYYREKATTSMISCGIGVGFPANAAVTKAITKTIILRQYSILFKKIVFTLLPPFGFGPNLDVKRQFLENIKNLHRDINPLGGQVPQRTLHGKPLG